MTVGLFISNGLEAVVLSDSRVSSGMGRQSDSVDKMKEFSNKNYHGVIYGAGNANHIFSLLKNMPKIADNPLEFVSLLKKQYSDKFDEETAHVLNQGKKEIDVKSIVICDEADKKKFIEQQTSNLLQSSDNYRRENTSQIVIPIYDNLAKKIRLFSMDYFTQTEQFLNSLEVGSGRDASNLYMMAKLQGVDFKKLLKSNLVFHAVNAYNMSTINQGVGGTPLIASISKEGVETLDPSKTRALCNLSGAYLSEFSRDLQKQDTVDLMDYVVSHKTPNYKSVAEFLKLDSSAIRDIIIPYSSWQERSNSKHR